VRRKEAPAKGTDMNAMKITVLDVEGMTCGSCVRHVDAALGRVPGVQSVEVDLRQRSARVRHDPNSTLVTALIDALRAEGYDAREASE